MKIKYVLLSVLSGVLLAFSFPNFIENTTVVHTSFFIWFAFAPLFYILYNEADLKFNFIYGLMTGCVFYLISLYWFWFIGPMGIFAYAAWFVLCLYFAALLSIFILAACFLKNKFSLPLLLGIPALLTFSEFVREWLFTGFPILTPAQSQYNFIFALQLLKVTGVYGLNYMIYFVNILVAVSFTQKRDEFSNPASVISCTAFIILIVLTVAANIGTCRFRPGTMKCAVLQANIDQNVNWDKRYTDSTMAAFKEMVDGVSGQKPDLYVWPETGFPGQLGIETDKRLQMSRWAKGAYHLTGTDREDRTYIRPRYYNSVMLVDPSGTINGVYSKYHLVPFGEYIPFQDKIPFVQKVVQRYGYYGFTAGNEINPLKLNAATSCGALICYDGFFPEISRQFVKKGAGFLTHLSYETWYGVSPASAQILTNVVLRAVENDVYLVRCVASGISAVTDNKGRILKTTKIFTKDTIVSEIRVKDPDSLTFYTKYGDWFPWAALLMAAFGLLPFKKK
jgi:apolipoprotein N-acyltransferase